MNAAGRAAMRFRKSPFLHGYAKGKADWDPAYPAVADIVRHSPRPLLDIGCGVGLLAAYLRESGCTQPILGIEPDAGKVRVARDQVAPHYPGLDFRVGDARSLPDFSGDIVLLDVLHYMTSPDQRTVLESVATRIAPGGCALIRTTFRDSSWRYLATMIEEAFVRASGWIRGGHCHFPSKQEIETALQSPALSISIRPMWGKTPFNSHLVTIDRATQKSPP